MTPWVLRLIIANVAMYMVTMASPGLGDTLVLVPALILSRPWTLVTYMFLHGNLTHILFNMLGLYFFGPRLEAELGGRNFLWLYGLSGLAGALLSFVFAPHSAIIGASGAVYGVFVGFAYYWPRVQIFIWGIFPIEARWLVVITVALSLYSGFGGSSDGVAHFAHLGGLAGGYLFVRWLEHSSRGARFRRVVVPATLRFDDIERWKQIRREALHEVNREEYDRIMEKLRSSGAENLSAGERAFLNRFSTDA
jgi:membrane associated rhomboid family serine protease